MKPLARHLKHYDELVFNRIEFEDERGHRQAARPGHRLERQPAAGSTTTRLLHNATSSWPRCSAYGAHGPDMLLLRASASRAPSTPTSSCAAAQGRRLADHRLSRRPYGQEPEDTREHAALDQALLRRPPRPAHRRHRLPRQGLAGVVLQHVPEIGEIYVLTRRRRCVRRPTSSSAGVQTSPASALHEKYGADMSRFISERVEVVSGDVSLPDMGVEDPEVLARLRRDIDLVINCAGLVDFDPDLRDGHDDQRRGARNAANFVAACDKACRCSTSRPATSPAKNSSDPRGHPPRPLARRRRRSTSRPRAPRVQISIDTILADGRSAGDGQARPDDAIKQNPRARAATRTTRCWCATPPAGSSATPARRTRMVAEGQRRAGRWGFTNIYTYTKNMAEAWIARRLDPGRWSMCSARRSSRLHELPVPRVEPGLQHLRPAELRARQLVPPPAVQAGQPLRHHPRRLRLPRHDRRRRRADAGRARAGLPVRQLGPEPPHHRPRRRAGRAGPPQAPARPRRHHPRPRRQVALGRDRRHARPPDADREHPQDDRVGRRVAARPAEGLAGVPPPPPRRPRRAPRTRSRSIDKIERMCELYLPFIHDNYFAFVTRNLLRAPRRRARVGLRPAQHRPGATTGSTSTSPRLRKWCFPLFENKTPESYAPRHPFRLRSPEAAPAPHAEVV